MRVLGLDIATVTGFCVRDTDPDCILEWGTLDCSPEEKGEPEGLRCLRIHPGVTDLLEEYWPDAVVVEWTFSQSSRSAQILNGMTAAVLVACEQVGVEYAFVTPAALKKFATGSGNAHRNCCHSISRTLKYMKSLVFISHAG